MKPLLALFAVSFLLFLSMACGESEPGADSSSLADTPDTISLVVTDTLGVLMGDSSLMFGSISAAEYDWNGNLLVMDALKAEMSLFAPDMTLLQKIGRKGSGPGEFQYPRHLAQFSHGGFVVSDWGSSNVLLFDSMYQFTGTIDGFYPVPPAFIVSAADDGFYVGGGMELTPADNEIGYEGSTFLGLWADSNEPVFKYCTYPLEISVESNGENTSVSVDNVDAIFETDLNGNVYVTVRSDSTYLIERYTSDGILDLTIEQEWERIAKTEEELNRTILTESHSRGDDGTSARLNEEVDTYPWHNSIAVLRTDDSGNLWVGQAYTSKPTFNVYDPSGELICVVTIPQLDGVRGLDYSLRRGLLAFDYAPSDYPKVYFLQPAEGMELP